MVPGNGPVVEIWNAEVEENIQYKCEIKEGEVKAVHFFPNPVLNGYLDPEKPERLYQKIEEDKKRKVGYKFFLQTDSN